MENHLSCVLTFNLILTKLQLNNEVSVSMDHALERRNLKKGDPDYLKYFKACTTKFGADNLVYTSNDPKNLLGLEIFGITYRKLL